MFQNSQFLAPSWIPSLWVRPCTFPFLCPFRLWCGKPTCSQLLSCPFLLALWFRFPLFSCDCNSSCIATFNFYMTWLSRFLVLCSHWLVRVLRIHLSVIGLPLLPRWCAWFYNAVGAVTVTWLTAFCFNLSVLMEVSIGRQCRWNHTWLSVCFILLEHFRPPPSPPEILASCCRRPYRSQGHISSFPSCSWRIQWRYLEFI